MRQRRIDGVRTDSCYDRDFFDDVGASSLASAHVVVPMVLELLGPVASVVDVGCGTGAWLHALSESGVEDVLGIDGDYVGADQLEFPADRFRAVDLARPLSLERRFDLCLCLEVAEHLPPSAADQLIESLTNLSDTVLFSAAVPHQGGRNHVNEQWPEYWAEKFRSLGWVALDPFRRRLWTDVRVTPWFAQNLVLYATPESIARHPQLNDQTRSAGEPLLALIHPGIYLPKARTAERVARLYYSAPARWVRRVRGRPV